MNNKSLKTVNSIHIAHTAVFAVLVCLKILMNNVTHKNLEFIQTTRLVEFTSSLSPRCYPRGLQQGNGCSLASLSGA